MYLTASLCKYFLSSSHCAQKNWVVTRNDGMQLIL
jgi:hypothetical protein